MVCVPNPSEKPRDHLLIPQEGLVKDSRAALTYYFYSIFMGRRLSPGSTWYKTMDPLQKAIITLIMLCFLPGQILTGILLIDVESHAARHRQSRRTQIDSWDSHRLCLPVDRIGHNSPVHKQSHEKNRPGTRGVARRVLKMGLRRRLARAHGFKAYVLSRNGHSKWQN